uniref:Complement component 7a n=1 Tax=Sinocyclocheilus rhinocerous TaxID=307959 RepID=A0A673GA53_9TELE
MSSYNNIKFEKCDKSIDFFFYLNTLWHIHILVNSNVYCILQYTLIGHLGEGSEVSSMKSFVCKTQSCSIAVYPQFGGQPCTGSSTQEGYGERFHCQSGILNLIYCNFFLFESLKKAPEYLPLSEEFWKELRSLPVTYDYAAYRNVLERFGTHYISEGTLGGQFILFMAASQDVVKKMRKWSVCHVFVSLLREVVDVIDVIQDVSSNTYRKNDMTTNIIGGAPGYIAKLSMLNKNTAVENGRTFSQWSGLVKDFPKVIKSKLRPLHELVKEVSCAGVKKTYLSEKHPCHCRTMGCVCRTITSCLCVLGVIHGDWACWSSWSSCREGQKRWSRSFRRQGLYRERCGGHSLMMEPHCFENSFTPRKSCKTPPFLANGFVLYPKDAYPVGSKIEYACIEGFHLIRDPTAECQENLNWLRNHIMYDKPCLINTKYVTGSPWKLTYNIGEAVSLSCPEGKVREGPAEIQCNAGLSWSPQPKETRCLTATVPVQCQPWENLAKDKCVCKVPHECKCFLEICATHEKRGRTRTLSLCKVQAMRRLGHQYTLAEDSACQWPHRSSTTCSGRHVMVRNFKIQNKIMEGASAPVTMTECEAAVRKCKGEAVRIVSIQPCQS